MKSLLKVHLYIFLVMISCILCSNKGAAQEVTGESIFSQIQTQNITGAATALANNASSATGLNISQATQIAQNLSNIQNLGQMNTQTAVRLLGGLLSGTVSGQLGTALSSVTNLGNINSITGVANLLSSGNISSLFQSITSGTNGIQQATRLLSSVLNLTTVTSTISQIASNPTSLISNLTGTGGGNQITNALGGMGGQNTSTPSPTTQATAATNTQQAATQAAPSSNSTPQNSTPSDTAAAGGCILDNPMSNRNPANTFGDRRGRTNGYAHQGIDIMIKENSEENGQHGCNIIMNGDSPLFGEKACMPPAKSGYGLYARFECGNGVAEVRYTHLNGCNPSNGKFLIGRTGNACPTPPHNHYEILLKNPADGKFYRIDPACAWTSGRPVGGTCPLPRPPNICIEANRIKLIEDGIRKGGQVSSKSVPKGKPQSEAVIGSRYCNGQGIPATTTGQDASEQSGPADQAMGNEPGPDNMTETITTEKELNESKCETCSCPCSQPIVDDHNKRAGLHGIRPYFDQCDGKGQDCEKPANESEESALKTHRDWMVNTFFLKQILPAMMLMTNQMTTVAIQQTAMVGSMLDAKHQLETQRLFQQMQAKAHKDYHPSEGMCEIGTNSRALATSDRRADLAHVTLSQRMISRALITGVTTAVKGPSSDIESRIDEFKKTYCNKGDNGGGLQNVCASSVDKKRINKDVDFTRTLDLPLTINADFTKESGATEPDAQDIFALSANLYGHTATPLIKRELLANDEGLINRDAGDKYLDVRAIAAKRSVAQNSFSAIAGMKNTGGTEATEMAPFIKKLVEELGVPKDEIDDYLGKEPSYFAQMEVLTKKIYQNPVFFTELYDKPVNVQRKSTAIEAINLMQDRDIYRSILRSEAMNAVILETMLIREQERVTNEVNRLTRGESR